MQAALTVRSPGNLPSNLLDATDRLLQHELSKKTVTDSEALQRLGGGSNVSGRISIWDGDTTTLRVDAITNAANSELLGCFQPFHACIDNVINCAAGPQLREDCHRIMQLQGHGEVTGVAKITRAHNLPSRYVLHTVGPIVQSGSRLTTRQETQLADCYQSCLSLASEAGARSVALCGISTGVFGYPAQAATKIALATVIDWVGRNPNGLSHVIFNTFGDAATRIYEQEARQWELL